MEEKENKEEKQSSIVVKEKSVGGLINTINLFDEKQLVSAENFLTKVIKSDKSGIKTVNDGLAILMKAQDLGLPFSTCLEHMHVINDRTGVDIHIIKALLSRAGCTWECIDDYTPIYEYSDGINIYTDDKLPLYTKKCKSAKQALELSATNEDDDCIYVYPVRWYKDFQGQMYRDYQLNQTTHAIVINQQQAVEVKKSGKIAVYRIPNQPVDYITRYKISRNVNGQIVESIGHFSYSEAAIADLLRKESYIKYARILIGHRAFVYAARDIASDVIMGLMETNELRAANHKAMDISEIVDIEASEIISEEKEAVLNNTEATPENDYVKMI